MKSNLIVLILVVSSFFNLNAFAQRVELKEFQDIYINTPDSVLNFQITRTKLKERKFELGKRYYWYKTGQLNSNRGSSGGFLLNGKYCTYDINKRLREEGTFKMGLKVGQWKRWYPNGEFESITTWKHGLKNGRLLCYNVNGILQKVVEYKDDVINGEVLIYVGNKIEKFKYKNGVALKDKLKKDKTKQNLFGLKSVKDTMNKSVLKKVVISKDTLRKNKHWFFRILKSVKQKDTIGVSNGKK